ncbi:MAG: sulfite exporter TauE/SafE family protein [Parvularculaceae bacterium]|nr:sulfite exporter TauE/SafE family protein [Parvularculaceae bacterium]
MTFTLFDLALLFGAGIACGWINVVAGGGSAFTVPVMLFLGMPGPVANGTNRIAIIAQSVAAVAEFRRKGFSDLRLSASLGAVASVGALIGAGFGVRLSGEWFDRVLALVLVGVAILMATGADKPPAGPAAARPRNLALGHALMFGAGIYGGFIQVGVGFLMMPILYRVMGLDLVRVNMHKVFITLMFSVVALAVFAVKVEIAWTAGAALAAGNMIGGWAGARSTILRGARFVKYAVFLAIAALAIKLAFF